MSYYSPSPLLLVSVLLLSLPLSSLSHTSYHNQYYEVAVNIFKNIKKHHDTPSKTTTTTTTLTPAFVTVLRGGDDGDATTVSDDATTALKSSPDSKINNDDGDEDMSLEDKVHKAMKKLGLTPPAPSNNNDESSSSSSSCDNGICRPPSPTNNDNPPPTPLSPSSEETIKQLTPTEFETLATKLSTSHNNLPLAICRAALHASGNDEAKATSLIEYEISQVEKINENGDDIKNVQLLMKELGYGDSFMVRRALALCDGNVNDARAVLVAEREEEKEEEEEMERRRQEEDEEEEVLQQPTTVSVASDFDPTSANLPSTTSSQPSPSTTTTTTTTTTTKTNLPPIFSVTTSTIHPLILSSPTPILLDIYADWCGPCQQLTPALENLAKKSNGLFRLAKLNSDEERTITGSSCLGVTGLPTLFGITDGRIICRKVGAPRSEEEFKEFLMMLVSGRNDKANAEELKELEVLTNKLDKVSGLACLSFSKREVLTEGTKKRLAEFEQRASKDKDDDDDDWVERQESLLSCVTIVQKLLKNVISHPRNPKYRFVNYENPTISDAIRPHSSLVGIFKLAGFRNDHDDASSGGLSFMKGQNVVNTAPVKIVSDAVGEWMERMRRDIIKEKRRRKDHVGKVKYQEEQQLLREEMALEEEEYDEEEEQEEEEELDVCHIALRIEGKKKVQSLSLHPDDDTLNSLRQYLPLSNDGDDDEEEEQEEIKFICAAKKLIIDGTNNNSDIMSKSLRSLGLYPLASIVVKISKKSTTMTTTDDDDDDESLTTATEETTTNDNKEMTTDTTLSKSTTTKKKKSSLLSSSSLLERRKQNKKKNKGGTHTMQSVGIYAKDDKNKAELIDGGSGVLWEHDVTDDESDDKKEEEEEEEEEDGEGEEKK